MKKQVVVVCLLMLLLGAAHSASATSIAFFNDGSYVDTSREAPYLRASLLEISGVSVTNFTGVTAAAFDAATSGADILVIPELERGNLYSSLSADAKTEIRDFVTSGGGLIMIDSPGYVDDFLNGIFSYSLVDSYGVGTSTLNASAAAGTSFEGGPAFLPASNAVRGFYTSSLPAGALNLYTYNTETSVFASTYGAGNIAYLGFDWFEYPSPSTWESVLASAVEYTSAPVPEPTTLLLLGSGLLGLAGARRKVKR